MARFAYSIVTSRLAAVGLVLASVLPIACGGGSDGASVSDPAKLAEDSGTDTGSPVAEDSGPDAPVAFDCAGKPDGTDCGGGSICLAGACAGSSCGDGYVDTAAGEDCDDSNTVSGDGCSLCKFDCRTEADCSNGNACDGAESCNTSTHTCAPGAAAADGTTCALTEGGSGSCKGGTCLKAGCGNGVKDPGEDCDDGNTVDTDGCTKACKFTCAADSECDDGNKCNGAETCELASHTCKPGKGIACSPKAGCSGTCEPSTGACKYPDADADGVACDKDCNDADPAMFPGAFECKDGKDNDCNSGTSDSTAPSCVCYRDQDKDGYALVGAETVAAAGACPTGYTRRAPIMGDPSTIDCSEVNASAFPGQTSWFTSSYCAKWGIVSGSLVCTTFSYDYNCNGGQEKRYSVASTTSCPGATNIVACTSRSGWIGSVPTCGAKGTYRACSWTGSGCVGTETSRTQECR